MLLSNQIGIRWPISGAGYRSFLLPHGGATEAVVRELGNAKKEILVQAYSFTSAPIAKALVDAHKRGVKVTVVLDRRSAGSSFPTTNGGITKRLAT